MLAKFTAKTIVNILIASVLTAMVMALYYLAEFPAPNLWLVFAFFMVVMYIGDVILELTGRHKTLR